MEEVLINGIVPAYAGGQDAAVRGGTESVMEFIRFCREKNINPTLVHLINVVDYSREMAAGVNVEDMFASCVALGYAFAIYERMAKEDPGEE